MSYDQFIIRLKKRAAAYGDDDEPEPIPLGARDEIERRLAAIKGVKPARPAKKSAAGTTTANLPGSFRFKHAGACIDLLVTGNPADCIIAQGASPSDLLPIVKALRDLRHIAIFDPQTSAWTDPADLSKNDPRPGPPISQPPIHPNLQFGPFKMLWATRVLRLYDAHYCHIAWNGRLFINAQDERLCAYLSALDARTGEPLWSIRCGRGLPTVVLAGDTLITAGHQFPETFGIDAVTGAMRWRLKLRGEFFALEAGSEQQTAIVITDYDYKGFSATETVLATEGRILSSKKVPWTLPNPPYPPPPLLAPKRLKGRSVAMDDRRGVEKLSVSDMAPPYPGHWDAEWKKAEEDFVAAHRGETKLILFDLATGDAISEQLIVSPPGLEEGGSAAYGITRAGDVLCVASSGQYYGFSVDKT